MSDRLVHWDPFRDLVSIQDDLSRLFGRQFASEVDEENYHRAERRYGSFTRAITLPHTVDTEKVEAAFDKGVLTVEVPRLERAKPKKITVKAKA